MGRYRYIGCDVQQLRPQTERVWNALVADLRGDRRTSEIYPIPDLGVCNKSHQTRENQGSWKKL